MSALEPLRSLNSRLFGDIVFFKAYLALLLLALTSGAEAASDPLCKSAPNGIWRISSYRLDAGVIAVSTAEAESRMGKPVSIGPKSVSFPGYGRCAVSGKK
ncbi:MAG TPA: hypothetical protein VE221_07940, partial [Sphingomicrobium sp.]|nr:hypothetical protein [Sphingomicrobium sp.]